MFLKLIVFAAVLLISSKSIADETITLTTGEYPPYNSESIQHNGLVPRIVTEAFRTQGVQVKYAFFPWSRAYELSKRGDYDGSAQWFYSDERAEYHYYSDVIMEETMVWFHLKDTSFNWDDLSDLKPYKIGAMKGYTYTDEFYDLIDQGELNVDFSNRIEIPYQKLLKNRIEVFPETLDIGLHVLRKNYPAETADLFTYHPKPLVKANTHLIFPIINPQSRRLLALFNRGLSLIKQNGLYEKIFLESRQGKFEAG
ncbi:substrate-binding periplasmic protein [Kiloniella sp.]|uniref:substrate-binding periplasmic protein n=1 Tax=Kiloniella sp. TaxID=1938587 RepID=UPI003B01332A